LGRTHLVLLAAVLAGCAGPAATTAGTASPTPTVAPVESLDSLPSAGATLPPMPAGFPLHPAMEEAEPEAGYIAAWTYETLPPDVYEFYVEQLPAAGFVIDLDGPGGAVAVIRFHAADGTAYQLDMYWHEMNLGSATLGPPHP
jgi:hypothetical protein